MNNDVMQEKLKLHLNFLEQDENNINLLITVSGYYRVLGELELAQSYLDRAKKIGQQNFWTQQGMLYMDAGLLPKAEEAFINALEEEDIAINRYNLAFNLYVQQKFKDALDILLPIEDGTRMHDGEFLRAKLLHHLQQFDEAVALLHKLDNGEDADVPGLLSLIYFDLADIKQAQYFADKALLIQSDQFNALLTNLLIKALDNKATIKEVEALLAVNAEESRLWFIMGIVHMRELDFVEAEKAFLQATLIWIEFYDCWINLGWCYLMQNEQSKAELAYLQAIKISKESAEGWGGLALVQALYQNIDKAEQALAQARAIDPDCYLIALAEIIISQQHDPEQAGNLFNKAFPDATNIMNTVLTEAINSIDSKNKVLH